MLIDQEPPRGRHPKRHGVRRGSAPCSCYGRGIYARGRSGRTRGDRQEERAFAPRWRPRLPNLTTRSTATRPGGGRAGHGGRSSARFPGRPDADCSSSGLLRFPASHYEDNVEDTRYRCGAALARRTHAIDIVAGSPIRTGHAIGSRREKIRTAAVREYTPTWRAASCRRTRASGISWRDELIPIPELIRGKRCSSARLDRPGHPV